MDLIEVTKNLRDAVRKYENIPLVETNQLSEILRDLGVNLSYLVGVRKELYSEWKNAYNNSGYKSHAAKERDAEDVVPEYAYIKEVYKAYDDLRKDIRTQISLWKNND